MLKPSDALDAFLRRRPRLFLFLVLLLTVVAVAAIRSSTSKGQSLVYQAF